MSFDHLHFALELLSAVLGAITLRLVGLAEKKLALLVGSFVKIDQSDQDREPEANQPALARSSCHLFEFETGKEFDLDQHSEVVEEPIESEGKSC